jgi:hypothetical protein
LPPNAIPPRGVNLSDCTGGDKIFGLTDGIARSRGPAAGALVLRFIFAVDIQSIV